MTPNPEQTAAHPSGSEAVEMKPAEAKALWKKHGGSQHGPNVEQYYIEEQAWYRFVSELQQQVLAARPLSTRQPDHVALLVEAAEALAESCVLRSLRGMDHVPSRRLQQDAEVAVRKALAAFHGGGNVR